MSMLSKHEGTIANGIVSFFQSRSKDLSRIEIEFIPRQDGICHVWVSLNFKNQIDFDIAEVNIPGCEPHNFSTIDTRRDYSFYLRDFSRFSNELYPLFKFGINSFNSTFTQFNRFQQYGKFQDATFSLNYYNLDVLNPNAKKGNFVFPLNKQFLPDEYPDCMGNKIVSILRPRMSNIKSADLLILPYGECSLLIEMKTKPPVRIRGLEGLSYRFNLGDTIWSIQFKLDKMETLCKLFWYFCARKFVMHTKIPSIPITDYDGAISFSFKEKEN